MPKQSNVMVLELGRTRRDEEPQLEKAIAAFATEQLARRQGLKETIEELRNSMVRIALHQCRGSRRAAAALLDVDRAYVSRLAKEMDVPPGCVGPQRASSGAQPGLSGQQPGLSGQSRERPSAEVRETASACGEAPPGEHDSELRRV